MPCHLINGDVTERSSFITFLSVLQLRYSDLKIMSYLIGDKMFCNGKWMH